MAPRKRDHSEVELDHSTPTQAPSLLQSIRSSWLFANVMQYIHIFGEAVKIDREIDVEIFEEECLKPSSHKLPEIGLALLKHVSSHNRLTLDIFDEYTRRQYMAKAPERNPFGDDEEPNKFSSFDIWTKLRVLHQLSVWTLINPDKIRAAMPESEKDHTQWRMEPQGWDADDRSYFVLDDNRLYCFTEAAAPQPTASKQKSSAKVKPKTKPKSTFKRQSRGSRASKRLKTNDSFSDATNDDDDDVYEDKNEDDLNEHQTDMPSHDLEDGDLGGAKWECVAITLHEYQDFLESIRRSRDPNEKALYKTIYEYVLPEIEKMAEARERQAARRARELENLQKLATAKRSTRIAGRAEKQKEEDEKIEAERKHKEDLNMARKEQERQRKLEEARESRMVTREQRLKDREVRRILHEEELAKLEARSQSGDLSDAARISERHRKAELERRRKQIEELKSAVEEEDWYFDCAMCGTHGHNLDDGSHIIACEQCNVWQHSACHGIAPGEAERDDFHFVCRSCSRPKVTSLKLHMSSSSPNAPHIDSVEPVSRPEAASSKSKLGMDVHSNSKLILQHKAPPAIAVAPEAGNFPNLADRNIETKPSFPVPNTPASPAKISSHATNLPQTTYAAATPATTQKHARTNLEYPFQMLTDDIRQPSEDIHIGLEQTPQLPTVGGALINERPPSSLVASTPLQNQHNLQSPYNSFSTGKSFANSPTPSLSATQGSTNVRFAPSQPNGSPQGSFYAPVITNGDHGQMPVKHIFSTSTASTPSGSSTLAHANALEPSNAIQSKDNTIISPPSLAMAKSPTKHDPPTNSAQPSANANANANGMADGSQSRPRPSSGDAMTSAPALAPSPGAERRNPAPPVKRDMPSSPLLPSMGADSIDDPDMHVFRSTPLSPVITLGYSDSVRRK